MSVHKISNSQVTAFVSCTQKYNYAHIQKLAKKKVGKARGTGIIAHDVLQTYYEERLKGAEHEEAKANAMALLVHIQNDQTDIYHLESVFKAKLILEGYFKHYGADENWRVMAVERKFELELAPDLVMPMRLDLLVWDNERDGAYLVDTKTTNDFWTPEALRLAPQFPKYVAVLRKHGVPVKGAIINQLRTRSMKDPTPDQLYKREEVPLTDGKIIRHLSNHIVSARKIIAYRELNSEQMAAQTDRLMDEKVCKFCDFYPLCLDEMDGQDTTLLKSLVYERSTYGYDKSDPNST